MNERDLFVEKIRKEKKEAETAGTIHKKDLFKHIRRMEAELREYDKYHSVR